MKTKEAWYAVIGGCVGAVLTMLAGSFLPLGAQSLSDVSFGKITCTQLKVTDPGVTKEDFAAVSIIPGLVLVKGKDGVPKVFIFTDEDGGIFELYSKDRKIGVKMGVDENGGFVGVRGKDGKSMVELSVNEHGGRIDVFGRGNKGSRASMGVNAYGYGGVHTWDKNGYLLK